MPKSRDYVGPYRLMRLIHAGTSTQIWEAAKDETAKSVAIKVLKDAVIGDKEQIAALKNEQEIAKSMSSPRVLKLIEAGAEGGQVWTAFELFSNTQFKNLIRMGVDEYGFMLPKIVQRAAEGMYYMHTKDWIHRDVKPENFLVSRDEDVKISDYCIAIKKPSGFSKLFGKVKVQGTRSYMSPELIRAKGIDERSDIYSFGCMLFELITGKLPYTASTPDELLNKHLSAQVPSPVPFNNNVSTEFAEVVKRMMAKKKENRPSSMWELLKDLRTVKIFKKQPRVPERHPFDHLEDGDKGFEI